MTEGMRVALHDFLFLSFYLQRVCRGVVAADALAFVAAGFVFLETLPVHLQALCLWAFTLLLCHLL